MTANKDNRDPKLAINNSRCDKSRLKYAPATHEFAHIIYQVRNNNNSYEFENAINEIYKDYRIEVQNSSIKRDYDDMQKWYLGNYADYNINEFIAEAFQEYCNCKKPSKYAEIVGKLIDEYFKR